MAIDARHFLMMRVRRIDVLMAIVAAAVERDLVRTMILMRRRVAVQACRLAARLRRRLILEARARRPAVGEKLAASLRAVGDHECLIAIVVTLAGAKLFAPKLLSPAKIDDFLLWAALGVILGGRLGYVLFYKPQFYAANPLAILSSVVAPVRRSPARRRIVN